jgi:hypothetical protein
VFDSSSALRVQTDGTTAQADTSNVYGVVFYVPITELCVVQCLI